MRRAVDRLAAEREPHIVWNAFIDLIAMEAYDQLSPVQQIAHLAFWYDSEVQNGGHAQYLENQGTDRLAETLEALRALGVECQAAALRMAATPFATPDSLSAADDAYHLCSPTIIEALERHLDENQGEYVVLT